MNERNCAVSQTARATITERGNGFPDVGDLVPGDDGELYRVCSFEGPIHTDRPGAGNYRYATVELADWSDTESDDDVQPCSATIETSEESS
jgi:hypothetical protein